MRGVPEGWATPKGGAAVPAAAARSPGTSPPPDPPAAPPEACPVDGSDASPTAGMEAATPAAGDPESEAAPVAKCGGGTSRTSPG
jgi:hypothetical protein